MEEEDMDDEDGGMTSRGKRGPNSSSNNGRGNSASSSLSSILQSG